MWPVTLIEESFRETEDVALLKLKGQENWSSPFCLDRSLPSLGLVTVLVAKLMDEIMWSDPLFVFSWVSSWTEVRSMGEQLDLGFFVLCPVSDRWRNELELTLLHYSDDDHHGRAVLVGRVGSKGDCVNFIEVVVQG